MDQGPRGALYIPHLNLDDGRLNRSFCEDGRPIHKMVLDTPLQIRRDLAWEGERDDVCRKAKRERMEIGFKIWQLEVELSSCYESFVSDWAIPRSFLSSCTACGLIICCEASYGV